MRSIANALGQIVRVDEPDDDPGKECNGNTEVCEAIRPIVNPSVNTANNRLNGYTFDDRGNTTVDAEGRVFVYDADNKQTEVRDQKPRGGVFKKLYFVSKRLW